MGFIMCRSIKLLAFWILFQFSRISVTQSITICLQVKAVLLNLQRYHFQSCTAIQTHIIRNMKHFLLLFPLLHLPLTSSSPCIRPFRCAQEKKEKKRKRFTMMLSTSTSSSTRTRQHINEKINNETRKLLSYFNKTAIFLLLWRRMQEGERGRQRRCFQ